MTQLFLRKTIGKYTELKFITPNLNLDFNFSLVNYISFQYVPVRYRFKKSWAEHSKKKTAKQHAMKYFDQYHQQVYGDKWSSIRLAILSSQKYGAVLNNYSGDIESIKTMLSDYGAKDIIKSAISKHIDILQNLNNTKLVSISANINSSGIIDDDIEELDRQNLHEFIPPKRLYSDDELYAMEQFDLSIFKQREVGIQTIPDKQLTLPNKLSVYCYDKTDVNMFPNPEGDDVGKLSYYLLDASSILPVIALDLRPNDSVLDLCAAPGGKTLAIAQTLLPSSITANDKSSSRNKRLFQVTRSYLPDSFHSDGTIKVTNQDALLNTPTSSTDYNKVLVDVPCLTDRHVLQNDNNNIFKPGRISERMSLPLTQCALLKAGLNACSIDGVVVYSTCTLAMAQNDGVIEATLEKIHKESNMEFAVVDISVLKQIFDDVFYFHENCRYGILVVPDIRANFGPMYVCKLKRLK